MTSENELTQEELLIQAYRRGLLTDEKKDAFEQAARRGLIDYNLDTDPTVMGTLSQVPAQFNKMVTVPALDTFNAPQRMFDKGVERLTGIPSPERETPVRDYYANYPGPQNAPERVAARVGEEAAWFLPFGAGIFGAAHKGAHLSKHGANLVNRTIGGLLEGTYNAPIKAAAGEAAALVGAGIGGGIAEEKFPGNTYANLAGTVAGGAAPFALGFTPGGLTFRTARWLYRHIATPAARSKEAKKMAMEEVSDALNIGYDDVRSLDEAARLQEDMPGLEFSLAEATQKKSLARTQEAFETKRSGSALDEAYARRVRNEEAIEGYRDAVAPGMDESPSLVLDRAGARTRELTSRLDDKVDEAEAARVALAEEKLPKVQDRVEMGEQLRASRDKAYKQAQKDIDAYKTELGLNNVPGEVEFTPIRQELESVLDRSFWDDIDDYPSLLGRLKKYAEINPDTKVKETLTKDGLVQEVVEEPATISLNELVKMRQQVSGEFTNAIQNKMAPNQKKIRNLAILEAELDKIIAREFGNVDPKYATAWDDFRKKYFEDIVVRFRKGVAAKISAKGSYGFYQTPDEEVAKSFWAGGESAMRQFRRVFGGDPAAETAITSAALDDLRAFAITDSGVIDPKKLSIWKKRYERVLDENPHIRDLVDNVQQSDNALAVRQAQLQERKKRIENIAMVNRIYAHTKGTADPHKIINEAINDPRKMLILANRLRGEREAYAGLQREVWNEVTGGNAQTVLAHLNKNRRSLEIVFGANHINNIEKIQRARQMAETTALPSGRPITVDPILTLEEASGLGLPQASSRFYAFQSGRLNKVYLLTEQAGRIGRQYFSRHATVMIEEALYDPEMAKTLANYLYARRVAPRTVKKLNTYLFHLGEQTLREDEEENAHQ